MLLRTAQLCQWPTRPSDLWSLSSQGYSPDDCVDFDFAVLDFWHWYQSKDAERVQVPEKKSDKLKEKHTWAPKYPTSGDILKLYYADDGDDAGVAFDPVADAISDAELVTFMDTWDGELTERDE